MRFILAVLLSALMILPAHAQKTKAQLNTEITTNFPDNTSGLITPALLRTTTSDIVASFQQFGTVNAQTGTTYTVVVDDYGKLITFNNASPVAVTLPQGIGTFATFNVFVRNLGAGTVTITPTISSINGAASLALRTGEGTWIVSDGANYQLGTLPLQGILDTSICSTNFSFLLRSPTAWTCSVGQNIAGGAGANIDNQNAGSTSLVSLNASNNGGAAGLFGIASTAYAGAFGTQLANRAFVRATSGSSGLVIQNDANNPTIFVTNLVEQARFDTANHFLVGASTAATGSSGLFNPLVQQHQTGNGGIAALRWSNDNGPPALSLWKSRGASIGTHAAVQTGDDLGQLRWQGDDGTDFYPVVQLLGQVDGTVGTFDIPGRLLFNTRPQGGSAPVERFRLDSTGKILFGWTASVLMNGNAAFPWIQSSTNTAQGHAYAFAGYRWTNNPDGGSIGLAHSRSDTTGTQTVLQNNDELGAIVFNGSDGTNFQAGGLILGAADAAPAANSMPMRLTFWTSPSGSVTPVERMRIDNAGNVMIPGTAAVASSGNTSIFQSHDTNAGLSGAFFRWANSPAAANVHFSKSRGATIGAQTIVQNNDNLGILQFNGSDGSALQAAAQIFVSVDGAPGAGSMPGRITFNTTPSGSVTPLERGRITSAGVFLLGSTSTITTNGGAVHGFQVHSLTGGGSANFRWSANAGSANYVFNKSRGATVGSHAAVSSGDNIGAFTFNGDDGTDFVAAAGFLATVDGTPSTGVMPGRLVFQTSPAGSSTPTERMRINAPGHISYTGTAPTLSACGTSPAISGSDVEGEVTMGTGSPAGCTITFATAYSPAPRCVVSWQANLASMGYTVSTTALTLTQTPQSSNKVNYVCHGT